MLTRMKKQSHEAWRLLFHIGGPMEIQAVTELTASKIKVLNDGGHYLVLYRKEWQRLLGNFEVGDVIAQERWEEATKKCLTRGKKYVFHLLGKRDYTCYQVETKLKKGYYEPALIQEIVEYFLELGYLDDWRYMNQYYRFKSESQSQRQMTAKLLERGIASNLIREFFRDQDQNQESKAATAALKKKYGYKVQENLERDKLCAYLIRKGFSYDIAGKAVREFMENRS